MQSAYEQLKEQVERKACPTCKGHGEVDDAEPGDIAYNTYVCPECKGSGFMGQPVQLSY